MELWDGKPSKLRHTEAKRSIEQDQGPGPRLRRPRRKVSRSSETAVPACDAIGCMSEKVQRRQDFSERGRETSRGQLHQQAPQAISAAANSFKMIDRLIGLAMLILASAVFLYYSVWTLFMPFVDADHPLHTIFPPRVWAIRIPVILILLGSAVVGSFLSLVMIRSNRKKALKGKAKKTS